MEAFDEETPQFSNIGINKKNEIEKRQDTAQLILLLTEGKIENRFSDKNLDKKNEIIELISGEKLDLKKLYHYIDNKINQYEKRFSQEYYREIFRLNGWSIPESGIISKKPSVVSKMTIDYIYGRFPKQVLPAIEINNKYNEIGMRLYKHFQFLTPLGVIELEKFIDESIAIMKKCTHWDQFVAEHAKAYGYPFQTSIF